MDQASPSADGVFGGPLVQPDVRHLLVREQRLDFVFLSYLKEHRGAKRADGKKPLLHAG